MPITTDNLPDDLTALKRIIAAMAQDALVAQAEIARLKFQLARYRRARLREGRLYVRDERLFAGLRPPAALFFYSPDRKSLPSRKRGASIRRRI